MKKLYFLFSFLLISSISLAQTSDLYFSMYGEGGGNNKWLEIYNGTGGDVDLSNYSVELYSNGSATSTNDETLSGILSNGDVYVIYNSGAVSGVTDNGDLSSNVTFFNGNDAVALLKMGSVIDVIGQIGVDPAGGSWAVGSTADGTINHTIVRKSDVCDPNPVALDSFGTDDATSEWTVYGQDQEFAQIGSHVACTTSPVLLITSPSEGQQFLSGTTNVDVVIDVQNFNVAAGGSGDGHIYWEINSVAQSIKDNTSNESIPVSDNQAYTVYMQLRDNTNNPLSTNVEATVNFSVLAPCSSSVGDIIVTEIMQNPNAVLDGDGEWFEVYNTTMSSIDINGWVISDAGSDSHTIGSSVVVPAMGYAVLGNNADGGTNGGVTVNYEYSGFTLGNGDDEVILTCSGLIIDEVYYDGGTEFPDPTGASMELSTNFYNSSDNDTGANWGEGTASYGSGDLGTPGSMNSLSISDSLIEGFGLYPNPTSLGYVNLKSRNGSSFDVSVYDVLGKQVIKSSVTDGKLDVSSLNTGLYIMKISQEEATVTKKLVIK